MELSTRMQQGVNPMTSSSRGELGRSVGEEVVRRMSLKESLQESVKKPLQENGNTSMQETINTSMQETINTPFQETINTPFQTPPQSPQLKPKPNPPLQTPPRPKPSLSMPRSLSSHRTNPDEETIVSVTPLHPDQLDILPPINRASLLSLFSPLLMHSYAAIMLSGYNRSLIAQLELLLKLLQCGLHVTYEHERWLTSFEPWKSLPQRLELLPFSSAVFFSHFLQPDNVFQFAVQTLSLVRFTVPILPVGVLLRTHSQRSVLASLLKLPLLSQFAPLFHEAVAAALKEPPFTIPEGFFAPCPVDTLGLRRVGDESKFSFVSPQEQQIYSKRQKTLDWVMKLSREYDVHAADESEL